MKFTNLKQWVKGLAKELAQKDKVQGDTWIFKSRELLYQEFIYRTILAQYWSYVEDKIDLEEITKIIESQYSKN